MAFGVYGCGQYKMIDVDGALMVITVCFGVVCSSAPPAGGVFYHLVLITASVTVLLRNNDHMEMAVGSSHQSSGMQANAAGERTISAIKRPTVGSNQRSSSLRSS